MSPFRALYGKEADSIPHFDVGISDVDEIEIELQDINAVMEALKKNLTKAQERMKL